MRARVPSRARWVAMVVVFGLTLAGCAGADALFRLAATVDLYFNTGEFGWAALEVAHVVGKVLGSGMA